jgi:hypothetical protein
MAITSFLAWAGIGAIATALAVISLVGALG